MQWLISGSGPMQSLAGQTVAFIRSDDKTCDLFVVGAIFCAHLSVPFSSLPFGAKGTVLKTTIDRSSGPGAPDIEIFIAPVIVIDFGMTKPPPGASGVTLVSQSLPQMIANHC